MRENLLLQHLVLMQLFDSQIACVGVVQEILAISSILGPIRLFGKENPDTATAYMEEKTILAV